MTEEAESKHYEELEETLDPHRREERQRVRTFVDSGNAREPDNPIFVLPKRHGHENVGVYLGRIAEARRAVQRR